MALFLKKLLSAYYDHQNNRLYRTHSQKLMKINGFRNVYAEGEDAYLQNWKRISPWVDPLDYRIATHFIPASPDIVPEAVLHNVIEPCLVPRGFLPCYADKNMFAKFLPASFLPDTLLFNIRREYYTADYERVTVQNDSQLVGFLGKHDKIIIKPSVDGSSGRKVFCAEYFQNGYRLLGKDGGGTLTLSWLEKEYGGDFVIQAAVTQCDFLAHFNASSVNTLRVLTYRSVKTNRPAVLNMVMRIGGKGSYVDNSHAGGMTIGIDVKTGKYKKFVFNQYATTAAEFNGIDFSKEEFTLPCMQEVRAFAEDISSRITHHRILNLDLTVTDKGIPKLIEFNIKTMSPWLFQWSSGPAFGEYTNEIIEYCQAHLDEAKRYIQL